MDYAIEVNNIVKKYNNFYALNNISFNVKKGEIFGLLGPNGAGKTTLISILSTLVKPTSGTAIINNYDIIKDQKEVRKSIGIVFQDSSSDNRLTVKENLYLGASLYNMPKNKREERINEVLKFLELDSYKDKIVRYLSGGMKRKVEIARALLSNPKILFLDEPTTGLDPDIRYLLWDYIKRLVKDYNITIFITTHYMEEAEELCDRIAIMDKGEIKVIGEPDNLKKKLEGDIVILETKNNIDINSEYIKEIRRSDNKYIITVKDSEKFLIELFNYIKNNNINIDSINIRKATLAEVFLYYTGRELR
ncbi:ABC transporter [Nanobdella aerobiophila]|uniref:ABC transporter n=1 Tax=Nanobdella aerobiophila TaxID=2586965 RepID=A0A915SST1_9ARCH|nr:ATP-binding cassette domain-containing protein [Nanobdella aerobiophila]BBL45591.1 ABC transporter [Nanobdella aerobiophila]